MAIKSIISGKTFSSFEKMKNTLKPTSIDDEGKLIKYINLGVNVYVYIDPYDAEMSTGEDKQISRLGWSTNEEKAKESYYN